MSRISFSQDSVGEVEEIDPRGEQAGARHGGLEPWTGEAQEGEPHVRFIHRPSRVRNRNS